MSGAPAGPQLPVSLVVVDRWIRAGFLHLDRPGQGTRRAYPESERRAMVALDACRRLAGADPDGQSLTDAHRALMSTVAEVARTHPPGTAVEITTPCPYVRHILIVPEP
jgi:hypothetical protein